MPFIKGQSGNPKGRPKSSKEIKRLQQCSAPEFKKITAMLMNGNRELLQRVLDSPKSSNLQSWVAAVALKGILKGDASYLDIILNRIIGKVKDELEVSTPEPFIIERLDGSEIILGFKQVEFNKDEPKIIK